MTTTNPLALIPQPEASARQPEPVKDVFEILEYTRRGRPSSSPETEPRER